MRTIAVTVLMLMLLSASYPEMTLSRPDTGQEDGMPDIARFVDDAVALVKDMVGGGNIMPPMDATSIIRELHDRGEGETPTRTDPIPTSWYLAGTYTHSRIYVAEGLTVSSTGIDALGSVFDSKIYPNATYWFNPSVPYDVIDIRIYDFGDGPGNVGGFFLGSLATRNDLYVDSQDLDYSLDWTFEIVAHEFQHLLHYDLDPNEDVWLNEGLADLSVRICLGPGTSGVQSHIDAYERYPENDLLTWDEGEPPDYMGTIADYGRAYAFVSYLTYHFGMRDLTVDLVANAQNSIASIDSTLADLGYSERFGDVLRGEKVADLLDDPDFGGGIYDQGLIDIGIRTFEVNTNVYPVNHTIDSTVRYSAYYIRLTGGSPTMSLSVSSPDPVEVTIVGTGSSMILSAINLTNSGAGDIVRILSGFGEEYDTIYVMPHTSRAGGTITVSVEETGGTPPSTNISVVPPVPDGRNGWYLSPPGVVLETSSPDARILYSWNGGPEEEYVSTLHPPEGISVLSFHAVSNFGLEEEAREMVFKVDTKDPALDISLDPPYPDGMNGYYVSDPTITLATLEPNDTAYYDTGGGPVRYTGPFQLGQGDWTLRYWAEDLSGRKSGNSTCNLLIDLSNPYLRLVAEPGEPDGESGFYRTAPLISLELDEGATGWISLNRGPEFEYTSPFRLEDGIWELRCRAVVPSGRSSEETVAGFKVDTIAPTISYSFNPPLCSSWCARPTYLSLSTDEEGARVFFMLGGQGPFEFFSDVLLSDGDYNVSFWVVDQAGNRVDGGTHHIMIDTSPPITELHFSREPDSGSWFYDIPPSISFSTKDAPLSPERTFYSLDGEHFEEFPGEEIDLVPGRNTLFFYSEDGAGNREKTRTWEIGFDLSPPTAHLSSNRTLIPVRGPVLFLIEGSEDDVGVYRFRMDFGDGSESGWIFGRETVHEYSELGSYRASVIVEDMAGRTSENEAELTIEVLTQAEYDRRVSEHGIPAWVVLVLIPISVVILISVSLVLLFMLRRREAPELVEVAWEDEDS